MVGLQEKKNMSKKTKKTKKKVSLKVKELDNLRAPAPMLKARASKAINRSRVGAWSTSW
ncbi:MAG: hypothetical protein KC503_25085 [Myxococcales bacterium]|nr:hypothetical protein [Myxococcales bacterium]